MIDKHIYIHFHIRKHEIINVIMVQREGNDNSRTNK